MTAKRTAGVALAAILVIVAVAPWVLGWSALPSEVATHFDLGGDADGHMSRVAAAIALAGGATVLAVGLALVAGRVGPIAKVFPASLGFAAALLAMISVATVAVNHDLRTWRDAELAPTQVVMVLVFAAAVGLAAAQTVTTVHPPQASSTAVPPLAVEPGERAAWFGKAHNSWLVALATLHAAAGLLVMLGTSAVFGGIVMLVVGLAVIGTTSVRVVVSRAGVSATAGIAPWPRIRFGLDEIESAAVVELSPLTQSGWGYRGGMRTIGQAAWIVRRGRALELRLTRGRRFVVSVDEPEGAAALLNGLLAAR